MNIVPMQMLRSCRQACEMVSMTGAGSVNAVCIRLNSRLGKARKQACTVPRPQFVN